MIKLTSLHDQISHAREPSFGAQPCSIAADGRQYAVMAFGAHVVLYSRDAEADRQFLAETLGMESVDAGGGWLIFAMPPSEVAVHPAEAPGAELYLMCDDLVAEVDLLKARGASCSAITEARWGAISHIALPGGGRIGLYQPRHPLAISRGD